MLRRKSFNSRLHNISKKRQAEMESGEWMFWSQHGCLNRMSDKQRAKIAEYRKIGFDYRGEKCFLCGRTKGQTKLDIHHRDGNRNNNSPENLYPLCNRNYGCRAHNHLGKEGLKELDAKIALKEMQ